MRPASLADLMSGGVRRYAVTPPRDPRKIPKGWVKGKDGVWRSPESQRRARRHRSFQQDWMQGPNKKTYT